MKKIFLLLLLLVARIGFAQTTVTATVTDPNGNPYANGTASAVSVPNSGRPTIYTTPIATNGSGFFTLVLSSPNTYIFTVCAPPVALGPTVNATPKQVCFSSAPTFISGSSIDLSAALTSVSAVLGPKLGSSGGSGPSIQINGIAISLQTLLNFLNTPSLSWTNPGGGVVQAQVGPTLSGLSSINTQDVVDTGTVNAYSGCPGATVQPTPGLIIPFIPGSANTSTNPMLSLCGSSSFTIAKNGLNVLTPGDMAAGAIDILIFTSSSYWELTNPASASVTFKTNGNANSTQGQLDIESGNNVNNYGSWFCTNTSFSVFCSVGGVVDLTSPANGAPATGYLVSPVLPDVGSVNAYAACFGGTNPSKAGMQVQIAIANTNTGASTLTWCTNSAAAIVKAGGSAIVATDLVANQVASFVLTNALVWQLLNPASSASGSFGGQQQGQPTIGASTTTATTEPATFVAQAFSGTDLCAKIKAALNQCTPASVNACRVIVDATTPGSADVCSAANSNFFSGVSTSIMVEMELRAMLQLKAPVIFPAVAHQVHGIGSSQVFRGTGFIMDPSFADSNNLCNFGGSGQGPFPSGHYLCLVIDGGGNWSANAFGGKWRDLSFDCNGVTNCIPFYTGNEQEDSGFKNVRIWGLAVNSATSVSACGFWDHSVATGGNTGPSHWAIEDSYCDPWGNGSSGTTANNTIYGFVYEGQGSGGNILIARSTVRASGSSALMVDGVWIDGSNTPDVKDIHCEWLSSGCVDFGAGGHGTVSARASNISDANHAANGVHFYSGSTGGTVFNIQAQGANVQDDINSCTTSGSTTEFYTVDDGGQGWWENSFHVCGSANADKTGALAFSASTSQSYTYSGTYSVAPQCYATPTSNPGTTVFWVTSTTSALTIHASAAFTGSVNYSCTGRGT